ncbi:MAG TPA: YeeE/YedE family protein [Rhizobacter sp.]|nr:YeeE/YedE family protein [Rhizobacter sp.]
MNLDAILSSLGGGLLIGAAAVLLLALNGRVAGVVGIAAGAVFQPRSAWRWAFLGGLVLGAGAFVALHGAPAPRAGVAPALLVIAGLLVGYGTSLSNGCTSGHGVCGLARLSPRSLVATVVFVAVAMLTTYVMRHVLGGLA